MCAEPELGPSFRVRWDPRMQGLEWSFRSMPDFAVRLSLYLECRSGAVGSGGFLAPEVLGETCRQWQPVR